MQVKKSPPTTSEEGKSGPRGINRHRDGSDGGDPLLQSRLVPLGQEAVPGAVGRPVPGVVAALLCLKRGDEPSSEPLPEICVKHT